MSELSDYLDTLDDDTADVLRSYYDRVRELVPDAEDGRSYGMPALRWKGKPLFSVMSTKEHLSMFPFSSGVVEAVTPDLVGFSLTKGGIRFSPAHPVPDEVLVKLVALRQAEITS